MKGMSLKQYGEVLEFINKYHRFGRANTIYKGRVEKAIEDGITPDLAEYGLNIKYIDNVFDTRGMDVWSVSFRGLGEKVRFATNFPYMSETPKDWGYDNIYDLTMAYLKGEFIPTKEFYVKD